MLIIPPEIKSYKDLNRLNFYRHAPADWKSRYYVSNETHKIVNNTYSDWETPWDFVNNDPKRSGNCGKCHDLFKMYKFVPSMCRACWKVVVRPRKHSELIKLRNLQREMASKDSDCWCKCGTEHRSYVPGLYGGYFYTDSKEAGFYRLDQVRIRVANEIGDVLVILKRFCTEFEMELGDSANIEAKLPDDAAEIEQFFFAHLDSPQKNHQQPRLIKLEVYQGWMDFGWKFGSPEDRKEIEDTYNGGNPLYPAPRKYERGDL